MGGGIFYQLETLGKTSFDFESKGSIGSNGRIQAFLFSLGYEKYEVPTQEQYDEAKEISTNMPVYPQEGSIKEENDYVIIKISE